MRIISGIKGLWAGLNLWKWGLYLAIVAGIFGYGYEQGQQSYLAKALEAAEAMDVAERKAERLSAKVNLLEASKATERLVSVTADGAKLEEELRDATEANPTPNCVDDEQLRILQEIAGRTHQR